MGEGVARHGTEHGQGREQSSIRTLGQGIILTRRFIGRGWSSASNATGRGKVRRLVPDQAPGQWAFVQLLALASPGLGSFLSTPVAPAFPAKDPVQSPPVPAHLLSFPPVSHVRSSSSPPVDPSPAVLCGARVVSCLVATCRCFQSPGSPYIQIQIPNPVRARLCVPDSQTQQKSARIFSVCHLRRPLLPITATSLFFHRYGTVLCELGRNYPSHPIPGQPPDTHSWTGRDRRQAGHTHSRELALQGILLYLLRHTRTARRKAHTGDNDIQLEDPPSTNHSPSRRCPAVARDLTTRDPASEHRNHAHARPALSLFLSD